MAFPFFVVLLALYPVLFIAASNPGQVRQQALVTALAAAGFGSLLLLLVLRLALRSWQRASLAAAVVLVVFYAYGPLHGAIEFALLDWLSSTARLTSVVSAVLSTLHISLTALAVGAALLGVAAVRRLGPGRIDSAVRALNVFAVALIALVAIQWWAGSDVRSAAPAPSPAAHGGRQVSVLGYNPDIYIIVMDGYAREDVLKEHYRFDNSNFLDGLRSRGFAIMTRSTSNYHWTFLSLASALNMEYLQPLMGEAIGPEVKSRHAVYEAIRHNAVMRYLAARGYRTVHLQSTWGATLENRYADVQIPCLGNVFNDDFIRTLVDASWLKALQSRANAELAACHLANFESLSQLGALPGPKLVFAHFLLPHYPYLFDRNGRILERATFSNQFEFQRQLWEERHRYIDQLEFLNVRIMQTLERIRAGSSQPPVILLVSDHGANIHRGLTREQRLRVRFSNFMAILSPRAPGDAVPQSLSLVNLFRRVFSYYFEAQLPDLPDRYFTSPFEAPYALEEVSLERPSQP